ncbi:MAG TPA: TIGR03118 family protein [Pirellulales bacterium]|nr:TIGR03118 family protein [Pirellulales bacterium]
MFSSADGTVQFIELHDPATGENHTGGHTITSNENTFTFPADLPSSNTANQHFLIATAAYAALPGAVTPDYIIPEHFFNPAGDTLNYADVDSFSFTSAQMPTDGVNSLMRNFNTFALSTGPNSESDLAGQTDSVTVPAAKSGYLQVNLVSDQSGNAMVTDPNLVNPWGAATLPSGPFWLADNTSNVSTVYSGDVNGSPLDQSGLVVSIPGGNPTGVVANTTSGFVVGSGNASGPADFIFASENGDITAWNPTASLTQAQTEASVTGAVYKGLALANNELFATNFAAGTIDVFDSSFHQVTMPAGSFTDPNLPAGFAPFGIQLLNGKLLVSYAKQDEEKHDDVAGFGNGFIDVYNVDGTFSQRLVTGQPGNASSPLNSPWGMVIAPADFGDFAGDLLVGNFGNGKINAFDPSSGALLGTVSDASGNPIVIDGLWNLGFGNGTAAGSTNTLFFTAGTDEEQHGLFGSLTSAANTPLTGDGAQLTATEQTVFNGTVGAFSSSNTAAAASAFTATIDWGDGSISAGTVISNGDGGFNVAGSHAYAEEAATETIHVTVSDGTNTVTLNGSAAVKDAPLTATGAPVSLQQGLTLSNVKVATFSDPAPEATNSYTATIDWGDGSTSAGTVSAAGNAFDVTGSHTYASEGQHTISVAIGDEGGSTATATTTAQAGYLQVNLVSDQPGNALITDPNLVNPWGVATLPSGPFWLADNNSNVGTVYSGDVNGSPLAKSGLMVSIPGGNPTGVVANTTSGFIVGSGNTSGPADFIFASENGDITAWNPTASLTQAQTEASVSGAVYKGLALANNELFATNFAAGTIDVFDSSFHQVTMPAGSFTDPNLPAGFAPFGIQLLNGKLFVSYAKQDAEKHDDVAGFGNGFIDVYNVDGTFSQRLITGQPGNATSPLNSPWGMVIAPANFGDFAGDLLVGNFGNGKINAFDPNSGAFLGMVSDASGQPIVIDGLWNLGFGNGTAAGSTGTLFFTAGSDGEQHGLFGSLTSAVNTPLAGDGADLTGTEGITLSGTIATFSSTNVGAPPSDFSTTINWGDGSSSAGTIVPNGDGGFNVLGSHKFAEEGTYSVAVSINDANDDDFTMTASVSVGDAALDATGVPVNPAQGITVSGAAVATFTDEGGAEPVANYSATIDWGDGTSSTGTISESGSTFTVTGSHTYAAAGAHTITTHILDEGGSTATVTSSTAGGFLRLNLVSDQPGDGLILDPNLVNPWGVAYLPDGPFWVADNNSNVSTIYSADVNGSPLDQSKLVVSIPDGNPTGIVANTTSSFVVGSGSASGPADFIFASENGDITAWNPTVSSTQAQLEASVPGAVYKGLALANNGTANELFATNFAAGTIDVFDSSFHQVTLPAGAFTDPNLPAGFAPFGIDLLNGKLYVSYAKQDAEKHDDVAGFGNGFIDIYNLDGTLAQRLVTGQPGNSASPLNSPWGMVIAPAGFGDFGGDLLVGNFGDGKINAFDPNNGTFVGTLTDPSGNPLVIDGLWSIVFGNGTTAGNTNTLFFAAGTDGENHGTFGELVNAQGTSLAGEGAVVTPTEGAPFSGAVATFAANNTSEQAGDFTATIDWGDGTSSAGTIVANPEGGFNVVGSHTYAEEATDTVHVTVADNANHTITIAASANVADAPLSAVGTTLTTSLQSTASLTVATFTDAGGAEPVGNYTATIDWGDGSTTSSGTIALDGDHFTVAGTHAYQVPGQHTITVTIHDEGGAQTSATSQIVVGSNQERLIEDIFKDLLDRDADDAALAFFEGLLNGGTPASTVVADIERTTEFLADEVQSFFQQFLHRAAEPTAVSYFSGLLAGGSTIEAQEIILGSAEFFRVSGSQPQSFLNALFQGTLGRPIDPSAETFFSQGASGNDSGREQVAAAVFASSEFLGDLVEHDFETYLGRPADATGLNAFVTALTHGLTEQQLLAAILGSNEFATDA